MAKDYTLRIYKRLIQSALDQKYVLTSLEDYLDNQKIYKKFIILRQDVDKKPDNALSIARIQSRLGVKGTYYFRIVKSSFNPDVINFIVELGHEIGYHYEDLSFSNGNYEEAIKLFKYNLEQLREIYPVKTICMHGSPLSKWDNKLLWQEYNYREFGIIAEPYLDLDFDEIFYLTDTGRSWNGCAFSIRDKVKSDITLKFNSTNDIISAFNNGTMPEKIMINTHPQRWNDKNFDWVTELIMQSAKNIVKKYIVICKTADED